LKDLWGLLQTLNICIMACILNKMAFMLSHHWNGWFMRGVDKSAPLIVAPKPPLKFFINIHDVAMEMHLNTVEYSYRVSICYWPLSSIHHHQLRILMWGGGAASGKTSDLQRAMSVLYHCHCRKQLLWLNNASFFLLFPSFSQHFFSSGSLVVVQSSTPHPLCCLFVHHLLFVSSFFFFCPLSVHFLLCVM